MSGTVLGVDGPCLGIVVAGLLVVGVLVLTRPGRVRAFGEAFESSES